MSENTLTLWERPDSWFGKSWYGWYLAPVIATRNADTLTESNWQVQNESLLKLNTVISDTSENAVKNNEDDEPFDTVRVVREGHWLCGYIEWVAIHPSNEAAILEANRLVRKIGQYPVLDEDHLSELEDVKAHDIWQDCYSVDERIEYIRENRYQFNFRDFLELLAVVRGEYFIGYASELLG